jgi:hypothetical protein
MKKLVVIGLLVFSSSLFATINIVGGQGYGTFRLAGAGTTNASSVMYVGVQFNKYIELRYSSLDTSIRMPVLPFRLYDTNYHLRSEGGANKYTYYDSDVFGINLTLPITSRWSVSALYGLGRSRISEITKNGAPSGDDLAVMHMGLIQAVDIQTTMHFKLNEVLLISPSIGCMIHFLDKKSAYNNALSVYTAVTVSYLLGKQAEEGPKN